MKHLKTRDISPFQESLSDAIEENCFERQLWVGRGTHTLAHSRLFLFEDPIAASYYRTVLALHTPQPQSLCEAIMDADCLGQSQAIQWFSPFLVIL
jgi:hypothetical protein